MPNTPPDAWEFLRQVTPARIALGRAGGSLPTREWLDFSLAHARAQDAVQVPLDAAALQQELAAVGLPTQLLASAAADRAAYLRRPDWGRRLDAASRAQLMYRRSNPSCDLVVIISDGLSAPAAQRHAPAVAIPLISRLRGEGWHIAPVLLVRHGRVAVEDEIGELLGAQLALILLGERPGLGSPDSLGAYFVFEPRLGRTDAERNCVSNIRPGGLAPAAAVETLHYLLCAARSRRLSGVGLKDERGLLPQWEPVRHIPAPAHGRPQTEPAANP